MPESTTKLPAPEGLRCLSLLARWVTDRGLHAAMDYLDEDTPAEIVQIAAVLWELADSTSDHADDMRREGSLTAEECEIRASQYSATLDALRSIWANSILSQPPSVDNTPPP